MDCDLRIQSPVFGIVVAREVPSQMDFRLRGTVDTGSGAIPAPEVSTRLSQSCLAVGLPTRIVA